MGAGSITISNSPQYQVKILLLASQGNGKTHAMIGMLEWLGISLSPPVRPDAVPRLLEDMGTEAVDPLINAVQDPNENIRSLAINILGNIGDDRAVIPVIAWPTANHPSAPRPPWLWARSETAGLRRR